MVSLSVSVSVALVLAVSTTMPASVLVFLFALALMVPLEWAEGEEVMRRGYGVRLETRAQGLTVM